MITMKNNLPPIEKAIPTLNDLELGDIFETKEGIICMKIGHNSYDNILHWHKIVTGGEWRIESMGDDTPVYPIDYTITLNNRRM